MRTCVCTSCILRSWIRTVIISWSCVFCQYLNLYEGGREGHMCHKNTVLYCILASAFTWTKNCFCYSLCCNHVQAWLCVFMYVCMCVYMCVCVCVNVCVCMCECIYVYVCMYCCVYVYVVNILYSPLCVCMCIWICVCMYMCVYVHVCICICPYMCMCVYVYVYMYVYLYVCVYFILSTVTLHHLIFINIRSARREQTYNTESTYFGLIQHLTHYSNPVLQLHPFWKGNMAWLDRWPLLTGSEHCDYHTCVMPLQVRCYFTLYISY